MKRRFTVFTLLVLMLAFAASAYADTQYPAAMNGTYWAFSGFTVNGTWENLSDTTYSGNGTCVFNATLFSGGDDTTDAAGNEVIAGINSINTDDDYDLAGAELGIVQVSNLSTPTGFAGAIWNSTAGGHNATYWVLNAQDDDHLGASPANVATVPGLLRMVDWTQNATDAGGIMSVQSDPANDYFFLFAPDFSLMAGLSNSTYYDDDKAHKSGVNLATMIPNGTCLAADLTNTTWYFYQLATNSTSGQPAYRVGSVKFGSAITDCTVRYYDSVTDADTAATSDNGVGTITNGMLTVATDGGTTVLANGVIGEDTRDVIIGGDAGLFAANPAKGYAIYTVMLKSGKTATSYDFKSRGIKYVAGGAATSAAAGPRPGGSAEGMLGYFVTASDYEFMEGNATVYNGTSGKAYGNFAQAMDDFDLRLSNANLAGVAHTNCTIRDNNDDPVGSFIGRFNSDKTYAVGLWLGGEDNTDSVELMFMIPAFAFVEPPEGPASVPDAFELNSTVAWTLGSYSLESRPVDELRAYSGISGTFTPITDVMSFSGTCTPDAVMTFRFPISSAAIGAIQDLRLHKLRTATAASSYTYNPYPTIRNIRSGQWWITADDGTSVLHPANPLLYSEDYYVYYVIEDDSTFDLNATAGGIQDPMVLGTITPGDDDDDTTGCVFNPAAGFGFEWLLLLLAPGLALVRNRRK